MRDYPTLPFDTNYQKEYKQLVVVKAHRITNTWWRRRSFVSWFVGQAFIDRGKEKHTTAC
jgi:hypothetical protein